MLELPFDVNGGGMNLLFLAVERGNHAIVRRLLEKGAIPNATGPGGAAVLAIAALLDHSDIADQLLDHGADVNIRSSIRNVETDDGITPLQTAAVANSLNAAKRLLQEPDLNVNTRTLIECKTALMFASAHGHLGMVRSLLEHKNIDIGGKDFKQRTAADLAAEAGHHDISLLLLETQHPTTFEDFRRCFSSLQYTRIEQFATHANAQLDDMRHLNEQCIAKLKEKLQGAKHEHDQLKRLARETNQQHAKFVAKSKQRIAKLEQDVKTLAAQHDEAVNELRRDRATHEIERLRGAQPECSVCLESPATTACLPCGHLCLCVPCAEEVRDTFSNCPVCRERVTTYQRIYVC